MKFFSLLFVLFPMLVFSQGNILFVGNTEHLCIDSILPTARISAELPEEIQEYGVIFIFSNARSVLTAEDQKQLLDFLSKGKGLYLGSENWPMQAESNQLTDLLYTKKAWGNFSTDLATADSTGFLKDLRTFPAGKTTVAFPLDYRLKVEAWVNDEPLILSGEMGGGKVIIDGGYSRFYCNSDQDLNRRIIKCFVDFLK